MAKRGFFAELQHQNQLAAKRAAQAQRQRAREHAAAVRAAERARREAERAATQAARASAAAQKEAEREARRLHDEARLAEVESLNAELAEAVDELETVLVATLDVDDFVDLEGLRVIVTHPKFPRKDLEVPLAMPVPPPAPAEPVYIEPPAPTGLSAILGGSKKYHEQVRAALDAHDRALEAWHDELARIPELHRQRVAQRDADDAKRLQQLKVVRNAYEASCKQAEDDARDTNQRLDQLIAGLQSGQSSSIEEYIGIVLGNSIYPERLQVEHEYGFDAELQELNLQVLVPPPSCVPETKSYRYVRARDEIAAAPTTKKDLKERYSGFVFQVALRSLHEVFEADRHQHIPTIALEIVTDAVSPATGQRTRLRLVAVGADRDTFRQIDLANVEPEATLRHLGAALSKNPYELVGIDGAPGVRGR